MENQIIEKSVVGEVKLSYSKTKISSPVIVKTSKDVEAYIRTILTKDEINHREHAYLIMLNRANRILGYYLLSMGGLAGTVIDPKLVFQCALLSCAHSIILCHNHPSSNLTPSKADFSITEKIAKGGRILDISLLDHIIITEDSFYSFADNGEL